MGEQWRVMWKDKKTGKTGNGGPVSRELARVWAKHSNSTCPGFKHWIEQVDQEALTNAEDS